MSIQLNDLRPVELEQVNYDAAIDIAVKLDIDDDLALDIVNLILDNRVSNLAFNYDY